MGLSCGCLSALDASLLLLGHESLELKHHLRVLHKVLHLSSLVIGSHRWSCCLGSWLHCSLTVVYALLTHLILICPLLSHNSIFLSLLLLGCLGLLPPGLVCVFSLLFLLIYVYLLIYVGLQLSRSFGCELIQLEFKSCTASWLLDAVFAVFKLLLHHFGLDDW